MKSPDLSGLRFGRLTAILRVAGAGCAVWECQCDCGLTTKVTSSNLRHGRTASCGCLQRARASQTKTTHGHSKGDRTSGTYNSWCAMVARCTRPTDAKYPSYGGRGIRVCDRWLSFDGFLADMGERPAGTSLDRFPNNNGNYEPGNCRWGTPTEQSRNTRKFRLTPDVISEVCGRLEHGEPPRSVARRLGICLTSVHNARVRGRLSPTDSMDATPFFVSGAVA